MTRTTRVEEGMASYPIHIEIQPRVHLIRGANEARFPEANTILVDDEILTLIDAGSNLYHVFSTLRDLGHQPEDLDRIILTHYHADHKGHAAQLRRLTGCEVLCHPLSENAVASFETMMKCIGIDNNIMKESWLSLLTARLPHVKDDYIVDGNFQDERPIDCGEMQIVPIHAPGHTHDHTCFGIDGCEIILLVDIDLTQFGPWYGNDTSDIEDFKKSIQQIIDLQPKMGISSHLLDPVTEGLEEKLLSYSAHFEKRDDMIIKHIIEGVDTLEKLSRVPIIYPRIPYEVYFLFEELMLEKHIELLIERGLVALEDDKLRVLRS
jgi:glyoxylase-like metal-dependent hydrolase (beta-lactamase superfamily II)